MHTFITILPKQDGREYPAIKIEMQQLVSQRNPHSDAILATRGHTDSSCLSIIYIFSDSEIKIEYEIPNEKKVDIFSFDYSYIQKETLQSTLESCNRYFEGFLTEIKQKGERKK